MKGLAVCFILFLLYGSIQSKCLPHPFGRVSFCGRSSETNEEKRTAETLFGNLETNPNHRDLAEDLLVMELSHELQPRPLSESSRERTRTILKKLLQWQVNSCTSQKSLVSTPHTPHISSQLSSEEANVLALSTIPLRFFFSTGFLHQCRSCTEVYTFLSE